MTYSDSLPVQFYPIDELTPNEKVVCGLIKQDCYCQPFNCDDEIKLQFRSDVPLTLNILSPDYITEYIVVMDERVTSSLGIFSSVPPGLPAWVWDASHAGSAYAAFLESGGTVSEKLQANIPITANTYYRITVYYANELRANTFTTYFGSNLINSTLISNTSASDLSFSFEVLASSDASTISFVGTELTHHSHLFISRVVVEEAQDTDDHIVIETVDFTEVAPNVWETSFIPSELSSPPICDEMVSFRIIETITENELLKSDCINVKTSHECTELIAYSNSSNFDGLVYSASPPPTFYFRVDAIFFEEETPKTQEIHKLSNGRLVPLRSTIEIKRLLDIGFVTKEVMRKINKILMHETITIDGDQWVQQDDLASPGIKKYNLKRGSVLLTLQDSVEKNTI